MSYIIISVINDNLYSWGLNYMPHCPSLQSCPFFNDKMPADSAMADIYKRKYCLGDNSICARWMVFTALGKEQVPINLFPNQRERANELIKST